jgi:hypothetical protein
MRKLTFFLALISSFGLISAQAQENTNQNKFRQLDNLLPTPNVYRTASGAPGPLYWQQRADYDISITLDEDKQKISGSEKVTYYNQSPDKLTYLWLQLDQNVRAKDSDTYKIRQNQIGDSVSLNQFKNLEPWFDGGFKISKVKDFKGNDLHYTINKTMMRVDLPADLLPGMAFSFHVEWEYNINNRMEIGGRSGYEYFEAENNAIYTIAQFYPRMAVYADNIGWQNKQFLGRGEFALDFGDFDVKITVPADHIVAATGELQNAKTVLSAEQISRFEQAKSATKPLEIVTQAEATEVEKGRATNTKTWHFKAKNVRDFGWASSRKFIWDAQGVPFGDRTVMAMSYYPKEGNPLWGKYSTEAVIQTLETYSKHTFDYPYPVAISVNAASIGMEYPMICFNYGRCEPDGTYSKRTKYGMISVIIHEVGHNYFPMIVNSDERQWAWMDEGLNTFLQYLTEQEFEANYPSRRGEPRKIVDYMKGDKSNISPIMTNAESVHQLGNNAYGKPATALNILRETVMGRELFDFAFKTYAQRWMFKHPAPADFFRTMEDASAVDLDWFWRGWFYTTDNVDLSIDKVEWKQIADAGLAEEIRSMQTTGTSNAPSITQMRNTADSLQTRVDKDSTLVDFYSKPGASEEVDLDEQTNSAQKGMLSEEEVAFIDDTLNYYDMTFSNYGGLVMPIILEFTYKDNTTEIRTIPAEIWKMGDVSVNKVFVTTKPLKKVVLDPYLQTADVNLDNNTWPGSSTVSRFKLYKAAKYSY